MRPAPGQRFASFIAGKPDEKAITAHLNDVLR
jgi:hypothetical protein